MINVIKPIEEYQPVVINGNEYTINWDLHEIMQNVYEIRNGQSVDTGKTVSTGRASWKSMTFDHKPTIGEVKDAITDYLNTECYKKITYGFVWKGFINHLSKENQMNYKAAYDLAVQTNGMSLPYIVKMKKGKNIVYHTFTDVNEFTDFYVSMHKFINNCLKACWDAKDSIIWDDYTI